MKPENRLPKVESKEKIETKKTNLGLAAYIEPQEISNQTAHNMAWHQLLNSWRNLDCLEIQYEHDYLTNWWMSLPAMLKDFSSPIIVHGPTKKRDIATTDDQLRARSLAENKRATVYFDFYTFPSISIFGSVNFNLFKQFIITICHISSN